MSATTFTPAEVFPPGEYLRDELHDRGWSVTEFAEIIGRPIQVVSEILNGKKEITTETAFEFGEALGTSPDLWINLQTNYRLFMARQKPAQDLRPVARRARLRNLVPLTKARARGWLPDTDDLDLLEDAVRNLLEIESLDDRPSFAVAARRANTAESITPEQAGWLGHVRSVARTRSVAQFDLDALEACAAEIPSRTEAGPSELGELIPLLADCGVVLVFADGLPGGKLDGAVTFVGENPVIGLTARGDRFDGVLYTLLHECAHLTLSHIAASGGSIVDDEVRGEQVDPNEIAANQQADRWLFPRGFSIASDSLQAILDVAMSTHVHPSVVIGRLQYETGNWKKHRTKIPRVRADLDAAGVMS